MVSTERQSSSRSSSRRSYPYDEGKSPASLDGSAQPDDVREVAKRVLHDLEGLCVGPEEEDEESESDLDESDGSFDSDSEWGSESQVSSSRSHSRRTGGMTLEELTVALNAAIEYHRPMSKVVRKAAVDRAQSDFIELQCDSAADSKRRASGRRQKVKANETSRPETGEALFTLFQQILESKERLFYSTQAEPPVVENKESSEPNSASTEECRVSTDQQQQTVACVRDQATETESSPHVLVPTAAMEFRSLPDSPLLSLNDRHQHVRDHLVDLDSVGPTLADLAHIRRRNGSRPSASSSTSGSRSSVSSSRSSGSVAESSLAGSFSQSFSSTSSGQDSHTSRSRGSQRSRSSSRSSCRSSRHGKDSIHQEQQRSRDCKRGEMAQTADPVKLQPAVAAPIGEVQPEGRDRPWIPPPSPTSPNGIEAPAFVKWELDLSNFAS